MKQQILPFLVGAVGSLLGAVVVVHADDYNHRYKAGDHVDLWVNKVRGMECIIIP